MLLRRIHLIDEHFIASGNQVVYNLCLPCLLFFATVDSPLARSLDTELVLFGILASFATVIGLSLIANRLVTAEKRGVFIQGAFRGNMGIVGIAFSVNAYGSGILAKASIYLALLTIVYNGLSVWALRNKNQPFVPYFLKNPLIVAVALGVAVSQSGLRIPTLVHNTGSSLSALTLPLALLCIGGSLRWASFRANHQCVIWASIFKLVIVPALTTWAAMAWGFRGQNLGLLFIMMSAPTAAASYVMAKQMTSQGAIAAEIIAFTTGACAITVTFGLAALKSGNYI